MSYSQLSIKELTTIHVSLAQGMGMRQIARVLELSLSTISRENKVLRHFMWSWPDPACVRQDYQSDRASR